MNALHLNITSCVVCDCMACVVLF